jgi:hypothetical protein
MATMSPAISAFWEIAEASNSQSVTNSRLADGHSNLLEAFANRRIPG